MKKTFVIIFYLLLSFQGKTQTEDSITTIDDFFTGIPVKAGFAKWVEYLYKHPYLGLDSANNRGSYSSLKPGIKSHFPFPDSVQVKILAGNMLRKIPGIDKLIVQQELFIEAVFGNGKAGEKSAREYFEQLKNLLKKYYKKRDTYSYDRVYYSKGVNKDFSDFMITVDYSEELNFYFVMLVYEGN
jgi:hypothetical protein